MSGRAYCLKTIISRVRQMRNLIEIKNEHFLIMMNSPVSCSQKCIMNLMEQQPWLKVIILRWIETSYIMYYWVELHEDSTNIQCTKDYFSCTFFFFGKMKTCFMFRLRLSFLFWLMLNILHCALPWFSLFIKINCIV